MDLYYTTVTAFIFIFLSIIDVVQNAAPVFTGLPISVNVGELEYNERLVYELSVTDVNNDFFLCNVLSTDPPNSPVRVLRDPDSKLYGVRTDHPDPGTVANPNYIFNYTVQNTYLVTVRCRDSNGEYSDDTLEIDIIPNDRLEFTNLPNSVTVDASTTFADAVLFTVQSRDLVNNNLILGSDSVIYKMNTVPQTDSFKISGTGVITTTKDLKYETNNPIYLYITVSDGLIEVKEKFRVDLLNVNNVPVINNLYFRLTVVETAAVGTTLYTISGSDADAGDTLQYSMHVDPVGETGKFTFDPLTGVLKSSGTFDYETRTYYNVTFNITDTKATSGPYVLDVHILNAEEPCYFVDSNYYMSAYEGNAGSLVNFNPNFLVRDYDGTSTWSLSLVNANNSGRFTMAGSTGLMNYAVNYDVDQNAMPSVVYLTAKCTDLTGQTGTTGLTIFIQDVNDNAPRFPQGSYTYALDQFTALGTIATLTATDLDLTSNNNQYSCKGDTVTTTSIWYSIGTDCTVNFLTRTNLAYGTVVSYSVTATDNGSPPLTGTTIVNLVYSETTTTTTSTTTTTTATTTTAATTTDWFDNSGNVALFITMLLLGLLLLGLLLYFCLRFCWTGACCGPHPCDFCGMCRNCNQPNDYTPRRQITPPSRRQVTPQSRSRDLEPRKSYGRRDYLDYPQAVSPSDAALGLERTVPRLPIGKQAAIGYY